MSRPVPGRGMGRGFSLAPVVGRGFSLAPVVGRGFSLAPLPFSRQGSA